MATTARPIKPGKKGPEPAKRAPAWTGARTFSPSSTPRPPSAAPTAAQPAATNGTAKPEDGVLRPLTGLIGTTITLQTKTGAHYEGVVMSTSGEGDTTGVTLKDAKDITQPGAPLKDQQFVASTNIDKWSSGPALVPGPQDSFRTDTDISAKKGLPRERELQAWQPSGADASGGAIGGKGDDLTFGPGASTNTSWDQFATNEKLFGVKTDFDENIYTTKLDRSHPNFKEREREAQRIANEIQGTTSSNPHINEERNLADDSGVNEEDRYGAVVRGPGAYVPPGARRGDPAPAAKVEVPKVSVNGPDGKAAQPASPAPAASKPAAEAAFREFVQGEKQRLTLKRQAIVKSEMDKKMAELVKFSQSFKLNKPMPDDLVNILAKDEEKQKAIREKATKDAAAANARSIGPSSTATQTAAPGVPRSVLPPPSNKLKASVASPKAAAAPPATTGNQKTAATKPAADKPRLSASGKPLVSMVIQPIPAFKGQKARPVSQQPPASTAQVPMSPNGNNKLNVNASSFKPTTKASPSPSPSTTTSSTPNGVATKPKPEAPNPFFGARPLRKLPAVHLKDDFNPFKHGKVVDARDAAPAWPYTGKRFMLMFPMPQQQQQQQQQPAQQQQPSPHMVQPVPPPMPPPPYEDDPTQQQQQAQARGYVYAYPPYGYPGQMMQPMMAGMPPPGPPGAYMPGPYMQPIPYPPGMPPNMMYPPGMQMPPQGYMQPPPHPGAYPQPPNGAGPRQSMPATPIPPHAHPSYYHQSPQLAHAVPYPMMMPPPPHQGYEGPNAPPVQMGGHA
ncbi:hypothetical protein BD626DRAFT_492463 [Schizophyllum amplum]|uniref:LsmAD domain-containing protein n=1 Tax=Schizophyllum amplum TaxID=97359 RepID=A0A550CIM1_9AGAR|nr:hypothetical protein BD626DRAFT_492463 [Auriculariopsis ampla]